MNGRGQQSPIDSGSLETEAGNNSSVASMPARAYKQELFAAFPEIMNVEQVSKALAISPNTVRTLLIRNIIPGKKVGCKWRVLRLELIEWMHKQD